VELRPAVSDLSAALVEYVDGCSHGLLVHDSGGATIHANGAAAAMLGMPLTDLLGDGLRTGDRLCFADGTALNWLEFPSSVVLRSTVDRAEAVMGIRDPGEHRAKSWVQVESVAVDIAGGRGAITLMFDISDRYTTRSELKGVLETLQRGLVPDSVPTIEGVEIAVRYRAADGTMGIGGDFYDTVIVADDALDFFLGDVQGHGVAAASLTAVARHTLRAAALEMTDAPTAMRWLHRALKAAVSDRTCTAAFGCIARSEDGSLDVSYCLGGHPAPIVVGDDGRACFHGDHGTLLGLVDIDEFPENVVCLREGMAIVFYTDGLTDAVTPRIGDDELLAAVSRKGSAESIADELIVLGHEDPARSGGFSDDTALLVVAPRPT
jgi:serine phosphatase RsbU (regulator of sigma subunit)